MSYLPNGRLAGILRPAYKPCAGFKLRCEGIAKWCPSKGHVPRGFVGALSTLQEVKVVIVAAEPGYPLPTETYRQNGSLFSQTVRHTFKLAISGGTPFHKNLRCLLDLIFPKLEIGQQLEKVWVTESYLCSAPKEGGSIGVTAEKECAERYLRKQLELFGDVPVIACGRKAHRRVERVTPYPQNLIRAYALSPPGSNHTCARPSWQDAARRARKMIAKRSR